MFNLVIEVFIVKDGKSVIFDLLSCEPFQKLVQPLHESFKNSSEHGELYQAIRQLAD